MSRKIYLAISLVLIGGLVAAWHFLAPSKPSSAENSNDVPDLGAEAPISVKVQYARQGTLVLRLTATGYTRAVRQVPFTAQVSGVVDSLPVFEGKKVRKNDLLLKLNDADYRLAMAEAQEQLNQAMITFGQQRAERLNATIRADTSIGYYLDPRRAEEVYRQAEKDYATGKISEEVLFLRQSEYEAAKLFAEEDKQRLATV
jgi:multidrug efflux pump subunit AcrA (membrane-fusion protein)